METFFDDKNQYIYYEKFINPILYNSWYEYFNYHNKLSSYQNLMDGSKYIFNFLTENKNKSFIDFCYKVIDDIFNFLISSVDDFLYYKNIVDDDFIILFKEFNNYNHPFKLTLYNIYYSIIYFVKKQQNLYKNTYYKHNYDTFDYISDSDSDLDLDNFNLFYNDDDLNNIIFI